MMRHYRSDLRTSQTPASLSISLKADVEGVQEAEERHNIMYLGGQRSSTTIQSSSKSRCQLAMDFLRQDAARLGGRKPVPLTSAVVERQRRQTVDKRYKTCSLARRKAQRENQTREKSEDIKRVVVSSLSAKNSCPQLSSDTRGVPLPGFRYHNNGDIRKLSADEKRRRQLGSLRAGFGLTQSTLDISWLPPFDSHSENDDITLSCARRTREQSNTMLKSLSKRRFRTSSAHRTGGTQNVIPEAYEESNTASCSHGGTSQCDSYRSKARISMNPFRPMVKPLTTSSMWCHGGEELEKRESLIPKDSFNIKFGVSSKMLKLRKPDLDEYRTKEEMKWLEMNEEIRKYIQKIKK